MFCLKLRFQDKCIFSIGVAHLLPRFSGCDPPIAVLLSSQYSGETGRRVKARETHPVNGTVDSNQSRGVGVSDKAVILKLQAHRLLSSLLP
jgi:hypothetical protein